MPCKESLHKPLADVSQGDAPILSSPMKRRQFSELYSLHSCGKGKGGYGANGAYGPKGQSLHACKQARFIGASPDIGVADGSLFRAYPPQLVQQARFVAILREPVSRMLSWFNHIIIDSDPRFRKEKSSEGTDVSTFESFVSGEWREYEQSHTPYNPFGRGMYSRIIDRFTKGENGLNRKQLLVLNFDAVVNEPAAALRAVTTHFGLPILTDHPFLPDSNSHDAPTKVVSIKCETRTTVHGHFFQDIQKVYRQLGQDRADSHAPGYEPHFPPFELDDSVHCIPGKETTLGEARMNPLLIDRLEERLQHQRIAEYDDVDDTIDDETMRRRILQSARGYAQPP
jgi:hypothetical protein